MRNRRALAEPTLLCPLCNGAVATASGCLPCHLPLADAQRYRAKTASPRGTDLAGTAKIRLSGILVYAAVVAWCAYQLPATLPFIVPAAVLGGGYLHVWRRRPVLGAVVFALVAVIAPVLVAPALGIGTFSGLTSWL